MLSNELFNEINAAYSRIEEKCLELCKMLRQSGLDIEFGWYNGHYHKDESGQWAREAYPIPVIGVKGFCDIEIEFDRISVSSKLNHETALEYAYEKLTEYSFEAYGVEDYLADYYHNGQPIQVLKENIAACDEKEIGFSFYFAFDAQGEKIIELVRFIIAEGFYY